MSRIERGLGEHVVVEGSHEVYLDGDGTPRQGVTVAVSPEQIEQYRQGYRCIRCHGVQSEPFPEVCEAEDRTGTWRCGFPMRTHQLARYEAEHRVQRYGPTPLDEEERERERWKPRGQSGIWLP